MTILVHLEEAYHNNVLLTENEIKRVNVKSLPILLIQLTTDLMVFTYLLERHEKFVNGLVMASNHYKMLA